jgi:hypothetical protein
MVPRPDLIVVFALNAQGKQDLKATFPLGAPPQTDIFLQTWILDTGATRGVSATNALKGTTPR